MTALIKTLNVKWLRSQLGLVGQEPVLFRGTVAQNIAHGKPGASQSEIEDAAKKANAHSFIMDNLSDKYETEVGQGGSKLSGGAEAARRDREGDHQAAFCPAP